MKNNHTLLMVNRTIAFILGLFMLISLSSLQAQKVAYTDSWSDHGFTLTKQSVAGVEIIYSVQEFTFNDIEIKGEAMKQLALPGNFLPNDEGAPDLPGMGRYIAIPQGVTAIYEITASRIENYKDVNIAPAPRIPKVTDKGPLVYNKDMKIYSRDAFYPESPIILSEPTDIRGVDVVILGITPYQYNPVTKELLVYRDLEVKINFDGGNGWFGDNFHRNRWFEPILGDILINYNSLPQIDFNRRGGSANREETVDYIIITPNDPAFIAMADSLKFFRNQQGIVTRCFTTDEIGGNNADSIEGFINDAYTNWNTVGCLLIGDEGSTGNTIFCPIWYNTCLSDNVYADVNNNDLPDIIIARMTAENETQVETMVTKVLNHERTPPSNPDFYAHPITALGWQTSRWFQICCETIGGYFKHIHGKDPVRINEICSGTPGSTWSTAQNTSMVLDYFGPNGLGYIPATPAELGGWTGGNATMINNAINDGAFILQHRNHGNQYGWGKPEYCNEDIDGLTNTDLCYVFSVNCLTGQFNFSEECFAEKFHRYSYNGQNSGALGIIAASDVSYSFVNDTYVWGVYDNMWPDFMPDYQEPPVPRGLLPAFANAGGKYFLQFSNWPYASWVKVNTYHLYHHHGGAFMTLYSEVPQHLTVEHEDIIMAGSESFSVQADSGAFIALSVNGEVIGTADGTGEPVDVQITPQYPPGIIDIIVTKTNYYRYKSYIHIVPLTGPFIIREDFIFNDVTGNDDGELDYGESILLSLGMKNVGSDDGENVDVTISSENPFVSITGNAASYGTITSGEIVTVTDGFAFEVGVDVPDMHTIVFKVEATDGNEIWNSTFGSVANAPILQFVSCTVDDSQGNGNGRVDPGETIDLIITVANTGSSDSYEVIGEIINTDPYVQLNSGPQEFGVVEHDTMVGQAFSLTTSPFTPLGHSTTFTVEFSAYGGIEAQGQFNIITGYLPALVINLDQANNPSGIHILEAIKNLGIEVEYTTTFPEELGNNSAIFVCLGVYTHNTVLTNEQGQVLVNYLNNGGYLYMEGGDTWAYDPLTPVHPLFHIHGISNGAYDLTAITGADGTFTQGMNYDYIGANILLDHIEPESGSEAFTIFTNISPIFDCAVAFEESVYKTIGSSFEFGGLANVPNTKLELMEKYLNFFKLDKLPEAPSIPIGPSQVCQNSNDGQYTTSSVEGANMYVWFSDPPEATVLTFGPDTVVNVQWSETFSGTAQLSVCALNSSGLGPVSESIEVTVNQLPKAGIAGSATICEGDSAELTVKCTGTGPWTITIMDGTQFEISTSPYQLMISPIETMEVTISSVVDSNGCYNVGDGVATVTVEHLPEAPVTPDGDTVVNSDVNPASEYTVTQTANASDHIWTILPVDAGTLEMYDTSCTVTWTPGFNGVAQLKVQGVNVCGQGPASTSLDITVESSFGIAETNIGVGISVYPNPSEGIYNIEMNAKNKQEVNIKVMNALGFAVLSARNVSFDGSYKSTLDLSGQAEGLYFLVIGNDKGLVYKKIIRN
jgi:hypothetical protein